MKYYMLIPIPNANNKYPKFYTVLYYRININGYCKTNTLEYWSIKANKWKLSSYPDISYAVQDHKHTQLKEISKKECLMRILQ